MTLAVVHSKTLVAPDTGTEDKVYGQDYVSPTSHTLTGVASVAQGGTGLTSGTIGGMLYWSNTNVLSDTGVYGVDALLVGAGTGAPPASIAKGANNLPLRVDGTGTLGYGVLGVAGGGTGLASGTSGGVPYYSSNGTLASSALLASGGIIVGGGAGAAPFTDATNISYSATGSFGSGPVLQIGSGSTTSAGFKLGYISSGYGALWSTGITASGTNYSFATNGSATLINGASLNLRISGSDRVTIDSNGLTSLGTFTPGTSKIAWSQAAPAIASGFGTSPSISANNGSLAFTLTIGSTTTGVSTGTITMPAASTGWVCSCQNVTNPDSSVVAQTGGSTSTITLKNYNRTTGVAADFTAGDVIRIMAMGY